MPVRSALVWALVVMGFFPGLKQTKRVAKKNRWGCQRLFEDSVLFRYVQISLPPQALENQK
jgi:hypothetical protein